MDPTSQIAVIYSKVKSTAVTWHKIVTRSQTKTHFHMQPNTNMTIPKKTCSIHEHFDLSNNRAVNFSY